MPDSTNLEPDKSPKAAFPSHLPDEKSQGRVLVNAHIGIDGLVSSAEATDSTDSPFTASAVDAIKNWTFKPYIRNGEPVNVAVKFPVIFINHNVIMPTHPDDTPNAPAENSTAYTASGKPIPARVWLVPTGSRMQLLNRVNPQYPPLARNDRVQGTVLLHAVIGKDGTIQSLSVISGPDKLQAAAFTAVRQWAYKPYLIEGQLVEVETVIQVNFTLSGG